jgi:hypothetical protein
MREVFLGLMIVAIWLAGFILVNLKDGKDIPFGAKFANNLGGVLWCCSPILLIMAGDF